MKVITQSMNLSTISIGVLGRRVSVRVRCSAVKVPVGLPGWEKNEQSMFEVRDVADDEFILMNETEVRVFSTRV